jgi:hypothetical protein
MPSLKPESFEAFVRWLADSKRAAAADLRDPDPAVLAAATVAWQEFQSLQRARRETLTARVRTGTYREELELMAAADADRNRWLPRLRTPNGFAISALYAANSPPGASPVGLLVECPADLIEIFKGQKVHVSAGGRWIEIGEIDMDGKTTGDLPEGVEFKPPFAFRVGKLEEHPEDLAGPNEPQ